MGCSKQGPQPSPHPTQERAPDVIIPKRHPGKHGSTGWGTVFLLPDFNLEWVLEYLEQIFIPRLLKFKATFFLLRRGIIIFVRWTVVAPSPQKVQNHWRRIHIQESLTYPGGLLGRLLYKHRAGARAAILLRGAGDKPVSTVSQWAQDWSTLQEAEEPGKDMCVNRRQRGSQKESLVNQEPVQTAMWDTL